MKQLLQNIADGSAAAVEVPCPRAAPGQLLIRTHTSLVSAGTERMMVDFGRANWLQKARQQPDKVRMVLDKIRTDGLLPTLEAVRSKLDQPLAPGYCNVGRVVEVGTGVSGFAVGDRVLSNGRHAEMVAVPRNLCARIPEGVSDEHASFAVLGAIGLQGVRLAQPTLGECVVVSGLGLIGLLTVQLLRAQGCRVLGLDFDPARLALAERFGAETVRLGQADPLPAAERFSRGRGVDAVLITAATRSNEPVQQAARICRKRGRIVLVGVAGLELSRADFYEKELSFQVSCSYGPGRYDPAYEEGGQDYPVGFVRWTEQRNFEAVLDQMASGALAVEPLISHRFDIDAADQAYALLGAGTPSLGILLRYPERPAELQRQVRIDLAAAPAAAAGGHRSAPALAVLGAGNYAGRVLIPALAAAGARLHTLVSGAGVSAAHYGRKFGFAHAATDAAAALADPAVAAVVIATRHDAHARQVLAALAAGKSVFVEKPLCLTLDELAAIEAALAAAAAAASAAGKPAPLLMVGFNRRFAPQVERMHGLLAGVQAPRAILLTVNAGAIPPEHWTQDLRIGGGRIVGEACHFIDLARHLAGAPARRWTAAPLASASGDSAVLTIEYGDGSVASIQYLANGHRAVAKERIEVYCAGRVLALDNFRSLVGHGWSGFGRDRRWRQDKGQGQCAAAFLAALRDGRAPVPLEQLLESSRIAIELQQEVA